MGQALVLYQDHLEPSMVEETLGLIFKDRNDVRQVRESFTDFLGRLGIQAKEMKTAEEFQRLRTDHI